MFSPTCVVIRRSLNWEMKTLMCMYIKVVYYFRGLPATFLLPAACLFLPPKDRGCSEKKKETKVLAVFQIAWGTVTFHFFPLHSMNVPQLKKNNALN